MKKILSIVALTLALLGSLSAEEAVEGASSEEADQAVFTVFLARLTERNRELETIASPDLQVHRFPDIDENEAAFDLQFTTPDEARAFLAALEKEDIEFVTFNEQARRVIVFNSGILYFILQSVLFEVEE